MSLWDEMRKENSKTFTENGCEAYSTSGDILVDFVANIGTMDKASEQDIKDWVDKLYSVDALSARKLIFYTRDILGGLGRRRVGRLLYERLAEIDSESAVNNIANIPEYGRFDDLYCLMGTKAENAMFKFIRDTFYDDLDKMSKNQPISGLAKWVKNPNSKVKETRALGRLTAKKVGLEQREFAKKLTELRKYFDVVELKMTDKKWTEIDYSKVPSRASMIYSKAFDRNDEERYSEFKTKVKSGESEIKATTLYPYDLLNKALREGDETVDLLWKALPNYIDTTKNVLTVCDVSGSMFGQPITVAISLAMYFSERDKGQFKNKFITFSSHPQLVEIPETLSTVRDRYNFIRSADWGMNTDLNSVFELIFKTALTNKMSQEDIPDCLLILTDMQFDSYRTGGWDKTLYEFWREEFKNHGYELPNIVFWNCSNDYRESFQSNGLVAGVQYVSGMSTPIFKNVLNYLFCTPLGAVMNIVNSERYSKIV
jgi:hypothetical protein